MTDRTVAEVSAILTSLNLQIEYLQQPLLLFLLVGGTTKESVVSPKNKDEQSKIMEGFVYD